MSRKVRALLAADDTDGAVSAVSLMEIAIKSGCGKLQMGEAEVRQAVRDLRLTILPFTPQHAYRLFRLAAPSSRSLRPDADRDCAA
jgi:PIN domain nuclease of toxin-antitoxin system